MIGLHHRHPCGQCFEHIDALGLAVGGGYGKDVELAEKLAERGVIVPGVLRDAPEEERSDEEIAADEAEPESITVGWIDRHAWRQWLAYRNGEMRAAARRRGLRGLLEFLTDPDLNSGEWSTGPDGETPVWRHPLGFRMADCVEGVLPEASPVGTATG